MKKWILLFAAIIALVNFTACGKKTVKQKVTPPVVNIQTDPSGAQIFINEKAVGKAPLEGKYSAGSYIIRAEMPGYETAWTSAVLQNGKKSEITLKLKPAKSSAMLTTTSGVKAQVEFKGKIIGQTPFILSDLEFGHHEAILKAPGYAPAQAKWEIKDKRPVKVNVQLIANTGVIRVERSVPGARVKINGRDHGNRFPYEFRTEQGNYNVEVTAPGYAPFIRKVSLTSGRREILRPVMNLLPGKIVISTDPSGVTVNVNNKHYGTTPVTIDTIPAGKVKIRLSKNNYDSVTLDRTVAPGKTLYVKHSLQSSLGSIEFVTSPAGVTVYLDGKLLKVTEKDPNSPGFSKLVRVPNLRPGKHTLRFTHKRAKPATETRVVTVEKNKNARIETVEMWIPNAQIILKSGTVYTGRIIARPKGRITFEPRRKSRMDYWEHELREIKMLAEEE